MFKTLEIKNFKSIGHATFDLGKINVLTGHSNLGKSNVVQAIYCLTHNHWDSNYLKWGEKKCSVRLTDESGEWVEYCHGSDSSAEYSLSTVPQPFTKIGREVPVPVQEFLQMNEVQFDEDLSLDFNFERQFDPSFVISLSGFELAKVFGKLMNLDIVMSAARNINKDLAALRKSVDGQEAIENVSIEYIQKNFPIELKYALLHQALKVDATAEELDLKNASLKALLCDIDFYSEQVKVYSDFLSSDVAKQVDQIHEPVQGLDTVLCGLISAQNAAVAYSKALAVDLPTFDFEVFTGLSKGLSGLVSYVGKQVVYSKCLEDVSGVNETLLDSINEKKLVLDSMDQWQIEKKHEDGQLKNAHSAIEQKTKEFNKYLTENNVCPISGKPFMEGCVSSILASV